MMTQNSDRIGNFTSSTIAALMTTGKQVDGFGAGAITYIAETNMEILLGRSLTDEVTSRPISWGNLLEPRVDFLLGIGYTYMSKVTKVHPTIPYWAGSPDGIRNISEKTVYDIKCPMTLKSFILLVLPLYIGQELGLNGNQIMDMIRNGFEYKGFKYPANKSAEDYYWQLVSNGCIEDCTHAELIVYMPYQSELLEVKELADGNSACYWMNFAGDNEIPFLIDGGYFKNLNIIRFEIPQSDKVALTNNVLKGGKYLLKNQNSNVAMATGETINGQSVVIVESEKKHKETLL